MLFLAIAFLASSSADASGAAQATNAWTGMYFANRNLQGNPLLIRADASIDFSWGSGPPDPNLPADNFSVRWTRWLYIDSPGQWTLTTITDDGVRLFIDNQLVIDFWADQPPLAHTASQSLTQGFHLVRMEYYDHSGSAEAHLLITSPSFPDWRGEYFGNPNLSGTPAFTRNDSAINFKFGTAGPGGGLSGTDFSVRWTRSQYFGTGRYRFTTQTDDGVRLWVDNQLLINQWQDQTAKKGTGDVDLTAGYHWLKMEYYQHSTGAQAALSWLPVTGSTDLWHGEYFDNAELAAPVVLSRDDALLNFDWGTAPPGPGITAGPDWSARWTMRQTVGLAGFYTVSATADDGVRVWADKDLVIDGWHDQPPTTYAATVFLNSGTHDWRVEYYQHGGAASLRVQVNAGAWSPPTSTASANGDVIVDEMDAAFFKSAFTGWRETTEGYRKHALTLPNKAFTEADANWARWYPRLNAPGNYDVAVFIPLNGATTRNARYLIVHSGTSDLRSVNQVLYAGQWVTLGNYDFDGSGGEYVTLSDVTYEAPGSSTVAVDAVKFSPR